MTCGHEEQGKIFEGDKCRDSLQRGMLQDSPTIRTQSPVYKNKTYQEFARSRTFQEPGRSRIPLEFPVPTKTVPYFPMSRTTPQDSPVRTHQSSPVRTPQESSMSRTLPESPLSGTQGSSDMMTAMNTMMKQQMQMQKLMVQMIAKNHEQDKRLNQTEKKLRSKQGQLEHGLTPESVKKNSRNKTEKERKLQSERNQLEHLRLYMRTQQKKSMDFKRKQDLEGKAVEQHKKTDQIAEQLKCRQEQEIKKKLKTYKHVWCVSNTDAILNRCEKNEGGKEEGCGLKRKNEEKTAEFPIKIWKSNDVAWEDKESGELQSMELKDIEKETIRQKKLLILNQECLVEHEVEEESTEQNAVGQELKHMVESDMEHDKLERFDSCQNVQKQQLKVVVETVRIKEEVEEAVDYELEHMENELERLGCQNVQKQQLELSVEKGRINEEVEDHELETADIELEKDNFERLECQNVPVQQLEIDGEKAGVTADPDHESKYRESEVENEKLERLKDQNVEEQQLELTVVKVRIKEELKEVVDHEPEIKENEMEKDKLNVQEQKLQLPAEDEGIKEGLENEELIIDESKHTESETEEEKLETPEDQKSQNVEDQLVDGRRIKQEPVDHEMDHLIEREMEMEKKDEVEIPQDQKSHNVVAKLVEHMVDVGRIKHEPLDHKINHLVETEMEKKDKVDKLVNEWKRIKQEQIDHELEQVVESKMEKSMKRLESLNDQAQFVQTIQQAVFNPDFLEMQKSVESEMGQDKLETDQLDKPKVQQQYKHGQTPQELLRLKVREAFRRRQQNVQRQELEQREAEKWLQSQLQVVMKKGERQQSNGVTGEEFGRHDGMPESSDERQAGKWEKPKTTGAEVRMDTIVKNGGIELNQSNQIEGQDGPREFEEPAVMKKREGQQSSGESGEEFGRHDGMPESSDDDADDLDYITPGQFEKRRKSQEQDGDVKRMRFLERNRAAATRCRNKRKQWINNLEEKADDLNSTNSKLQNEVTTLRNEVAQLKQLLLAHKDCPVTVMQRKAQVQILPGSGAADLQAVSAVSAEEAEEVMEIVTTVAASAQPVHQHTTVITAQTLAAPQGTS